MLLWSLCAARWKDIASNELQYKINEGIHNSFSANSSSTYSLSLRPHHHLHASHLSVPLLGCCRLPPSAFIPPPYPKQYSFILSALFRDTFPCLQSDQISYLSSYRQNGARFVLRRLHSENTIGWKMHRHIARPLTDFIRRPILNSFCLQQSHLSGVGGSAANGSLKNGGCRY